MSDGRLLISSVHKKQKARSLTPRAFFTITFSTSVSSVQLHFWTCSIDARTVSPEKEHLFRAT